MTSTTTTDKSTPRAAHPTAKAFFDALDSSKSSSRQSESLKRRSQSLGWRNRHSQDDLYPVRIASSEFSVRQVQRGEIEGTYGTGATVWPAAMVLMKYMEKHRHVIAGKRVMDLGSGTGVTSIAAAVLDASFVCCTDGEDTVVNLASENVDLAAVTLNGSTGDDDVPANINNCPIQVRKLWWGADTVTSKFDVVLVADCVLPKLYPIAPLVQVIDELLTEPSAVAILSYEHRYYPEYHPREKFLELASERGLEVVVVPMEEHDSTYSVEDIEIWTVRRMR